MRLGNQVFLTVGSTIRKYPRTTCAMVLYSNLHAHAYTDTHSYTNGYSVFHAYPCRHPYSGAAHTHVSPKHSIHYS